MNKKILNILTACFLVMAVTGTLWAVDSSDLRFRYGITATPAEINQIDGVTFGGASQGDPIVNGQKNETIFNAEIVLLCKEYMMTSGHLSWLTSMGNSVAFSGTSAIQFNFPTITSGVSGYRLLLKKVEGDGAIALRSACVAYGTSSTTDYLEYPSGTTNVTTHSAINEDGEWLEYQAHYSGATNYWLLIHDGTNNLVSKKAYDSNGISLYEDSGTTRWYLSDAGKWTGRIVQALDSNGIEFYESSGTTKAITIEADGDVALIGVLKPKVVTPSWTAGSGFVLAITKQGQIFEINRGGGIADKGTAHAGVTVVLPTPIADLFGVAVNIRATDSGTSPITLFVNGSTTIGKSGVTETYQIIVPDAMGDNVTLRACGAASSGVSWYIESYYIQ